MTSTGHTIMTNHGQLLPLTRDIRDALSTYARQTWPRDTAKHMARAWKVAPTTATNILKGHASATTLTHVLRTGGWAVAVPVLGAVIGHSFEAWLNQEQGRIARERAQYEAAERRLVALAGGLRAVSALPDPDRSFLGGFADREGLPQRRRKAGGADPTPDGRE